VPFTNKTYDNPNPTGHLCDVSNFIPFHSSKPQCGGGCGVHDNDDDSAL
jgi:hypothetical protein